MLKAGIYWVSSGLEERWDPDCLAWCREGATEHFAEDLEQVMEVARWHVCFVLFSQMDHAGPCLLVTLPNVHLIRKFGIKTFQCSPLCGFVLDL